MPGQPLISVRRATALNIYGLRDTGCNRHNRCGTIIFVDTQIPNAQILVDAFIPDLHDKVPSAELHWVAVSVFQRAVKGKKITAID